MRSEDEIRERIKYCQDCLTHQDHSDYLAQLEISEWITTINILNWVLREDNQ